MLLCDYTLTKVLFVKTLHEKQVRNWSLVQKGYKGQTRRESGTQEEVKKKKEQGGIEMRDEWGSG